MKIIQAHSFSLILSALAREAKELMMLWIPSGVFMMGSPKDEPGRVDEEEDQFEVTITKGFWLSQYLVTQAQWQAVMGDNSSHFKQGLDSPVENISWYQAMAFCHKLNNFFAKDLPKEYGFSLPTEAQWEYACRAGTQTIYHSGNSLDDLTRVSWHKDNSGGHTHPVGEKEPNAWGLYDMHGNVFEWCYDAPSSYPHSAAVDWIGSGDGLVRVVRGGAWGTIPDDCSFRCACRNWVEPDVTRPWFGFRLSLRVIGP